VTVASGRPDSLTPSKTSVSNQSELGKRAPVGAAVEQAARAVANRTRTLRRRDNEDSVGSQYRSTPRDRGRCEHIASNGRRVQDARSRAGYLRGFPGQSGSTD
jgi:hypothetical protein